MGSPYLEHDVELLRAAGERVPDGGTIICSDPSNHRHEWMKPPAPAAPVEAPVDIASRPELGGGLDPRSPEWRAFALREDLVAAMATELGPHLARDAVYGPVEYPPPWRWDNTQEAWGLFDARGNLLIDTNEFGVTTFPPRVRALTEAAPEMFDLLRSCATGDAIFNAKVNALLARIDAASKPR